MIRTLDHFRHDLVYGFRTMARQPVFTLAAVLALMIGIGFVTAQFTVLNGFIFRPLPFEQGERLLDISPSGDDPVEAESKPPMFTMAAFSAFRERQQAFEDIAGFSLGTINVSDGVSPKRYDGSFVTANFHRVLRVDPILGRGFTGADESPDAAPALLISERVWKRDFKGDPKVVGKDVLINSRPGRIIGVMPAGFHFPEREDAWLATPVLNAPDGGVMDRLVKAVGRLRDDVSIDEAQVDANAVMEGIPEASKGYFKGLHEAKLQSIQRAVIGSVTVKVLWIMMVSVAFILLIACANVSNLLFARSAVRGRELAIRSALGASRRRIVMQMLTECLALCLLGATGGVIVTLWSMEWMSGMIDAAEMPYWIDFSLDGRILLFVCLVTVLSALLSGFFPALKASKMNVNSLLKDGSGTISSMRIGLFSKGLIITQVSLSFVLLVLAGLMVQVVNTQHRAGLPFEPEKVLSARFGLFEGDYHEETDVGEFAAALADQLKAHESIAGASVTSRMQFHQTDEAWVRTSGMPETEPDFHVYREAVLPGYFDALGAPLLAGRDFGAGDTAGSEAVVIVNESFARKRWPDGVVLGRLVGIEREGSEDHVWARVVGVAPDLLMSGFQPGWKEGAGLYLPLAQKPSRFLTVVLRGLDGVPAASLIPVLRRTVHTLDPDLPVYWTRTHQDSIDLTLAGNRIVMIMFVVFGLSALFLAAMGIFAVVTFSVNQRRVEIGIRMALGARVSDIKALVVRQGFVQLLIGLAIGAGLSAVLGSLLRSTLVGVITHDAVTYLLSVVILTVVSTAAGILPARRAARVDPMVALRKE